MKNNTNQIMKLDLPIWIKYWLAKHKNISYILSEILTGTEFFLEDSAPKKFKIFDIIGRTTQESTTGKNLLEKLINIPKSNGAKYSTDRLSVKVDFANSSDEYFAICNVESPTTKAYTLAFKASGVKNGETPKYNVDGRTSSIKTLVNGLNVVNIPSGTTIANNHLLFDDQQKTLYPNTSTVTFTDFMLVEGTYTEETMPAYEPYTGGEPAPNPNYPYAIKNTGDNGSVNENVSNSDGTQEQNISFPLSQGQKFYEGSYPDDDEKVHHVSGEMLFDGSSDENWIYNPTYAYFYITTTGFKSADFCDNYSKETSETLTNNHFRFNPNNGNLYIKDERFTSASSFKTNLATNNIILQGELAEEQTEDFTEEQKEAWKEWKKARTYKNITHISSEDETPAELKIQYYKEG